MKIYAPYRDGNIYGVIAIDTEKAILHKSFLDCDFPYIETDDHIISGNDLFYTPSGVFAFWLNDFELMTKERVYFPDVFPDYKKRLKEA